jgi:hypothetical protein
MARFSMLPVAKGERLGFFAFVLDLERSCGIKFDDTLLNHEHLRSIRSAAALMNSLHAASETENSAGVGGTNFADRNRKWFYEQSERSRRCCGVRFANKRDALPTVHAGRHYMI